MRSLSPTTGILQEIDFQSGKFFIIFFFDLYKFSTQNPSYEKCWILLHYKLLNREAENYEKYIFLASKA